MDCFVEVDLFHSSEFYSSVLHVQRLQLSFHRRLFKGLNGLNLFKREERKILIENLGTDSSYTFIL